VATYSLGASAANSTNYEIRNRLHKLIGDWENAMADDRQAAHLYKLFADGGAAGTQYSLGLSYERGRNGLSQDDREAARLYKLAADQGCADAQRVLGSFYAQGRGGLPQDDREAVRLYKLAAEQGIATAQYSLGLFYARGRGGLPQDDREAARLYKLAANQGHAPAQAILKEERGIFPHLFGGEADSPEEGWRQKHEAQGQQSYASEQRRHSLWLEEVRERQRESAEGERQRRQQEELEQQREADERRRRQWQAEHDRRTEVLSGEMSIAQACEILGINAEATEQEIRAPYSRLMKRVHPDLGGSAYFSKELNAARDVLLKLRSARA